MEKETILKDVLYCVFQIDNIVNKFHNKIQFMNLNMLMQRAESWDAEKLQRVHEAITPVLEQLNNVRGLVQDLEQPVLNLIDSYSDPLPVTSE